MGQWTKERHETAKINLEESRARGMTTRWDNDLIADALAEIERGWVEIERLTAPVDVEAEVRAFVDSTGVEPHAVRPLVADRARLAREVDGLRVSLDTSERDRANAAHGLNEARAEIERVSRSEAACARGALEQVGALRAEIAALNAKLAATEAQLAQVATESDRAEQALRAQVAALTAERDTAISGAGKLAAVQALFAAYDADVHPEGRPSPSWLVGQIREVMSSHEPAAGAPDEVTDAELAEVMRLDGLLVDVNGPDQGTAWGEFGNLSRALLPRFARAEQARRAQKGIDR